jgi:hypothetical protein
MYFASCGFDLCLNLEPWLPTLPASHYSLPLAVGRLLDATVLSSDALRPLADEWCRRVVDCLRAAERLVTPLRAAAEERRELAKAAARAGAPVQAALDASGRRQKLASAAAQAIARAARAAPLRLVEAVRVPMLARRAQLELRAQLPALQVAVRQ